MRIWAGALWVAGLVAATAAPAADINHFEASMGPHNYLVTNHPAVLPAWAPSGWVIASYAHDPLVCRDAEGREVHKIIEHQANAEAAIAFGLFDWVEVGASLPGSYLYGPSFEGVRGACEGFDENGVNTANIKDPRVQAKVMFTPWRTGFVASGRLALTVPLAQLHPQAGQFTGETFPNATPAVTIGWSSEWFKLGLDVGYLLRAPSNVGALKVGQEITYGLGAEVAVLPGLLYVTGDLYGKAAPSFGEAAEFAFSSDAQFPAEIAIAAKGYLGPVSLIGGVGTGLIADYGTPDVRLFAGIGFYPWWLDDEEDEEEEPPPPPPPPPPVEDDRDGDGIVDAADDCPDVPEDPDGFEDEDGCPDVDNDGDGILDADDGCINDPEDRDRWEDADGCPDEDNDADGLLDEIDECPNDPEIENGFEDDDGCPDSLPDDEKKVVVVVKREKIEILEKVYFAYDSDRILPRSYDLLDDVAEVITAHTEIPLVLIEGHTDADGPEDYNLDLSDRRSRSVMAYLISAGVDAERLEAEGFGESRPIDSNDTDEGKANNRRVEFVIQDAEEPPPEAAAPADDASADPVTDDGVDSDAADEDWSFDETGLED